MDIVERLNEMIGKGEYYEPEFIQSKNEIERLREALLKITHHLDDNRHPLIVKNEALAALGLPLRELPWEKE